MNKFKNVFKIALTIIAVLIIIEYFGFFRNSNDVVLEIPFGTNAVGISAILKDNNVISSKLMFIAYSVVTDSDFQAGYHTINKKSYFSVRKALCSAATKREVKITVTEGMEQREIAELLENNGICSAAKFNSSAKISNFNEYSFLKNIPKRNYELEGYLFPDTYIFSVPEDPEAVIKKMLDNFSEKTSFVNYSAEYNNLSFDQIITLGSIIEREGAKDSDYPKIASVFYNRLSGKGESYGYLESCATVQYILKERKTVLSIEDTKIPSEYNTYINKGLPAGPIASPGIKTIKAALYPSKTNYLYFLSDSNGNIYFADNYEKHQNNMKKVGI